MLLFNDTLRQNIIWVKIIAFVISKLNKFHLEKLSIQELPKLYLSMRLYKALS